MSVRKRPVDEKNTVCVANWLTNFVKPKLSALVKRKEVPENLWHSCPSCANMMHHKDLNENTAIFNNQEISDENAVNNIDIKSNDLNIDSVNDINKSLSSELDELDNLTSDDDVIIAKESSVLENNQDQIFHNSENELEEMNDEEIKKLDSEDE